VRGLLQVFRVQGEINYAPINTYPVPITLFRAQDMDSLPEPLADLLQDPAWGWNQFSDREVEIYTVPGNHTSMMTKPHVQILAQHLQKSLDKTQKH
jgi:thioesterase domain-containing protein